MEAMDNPQESPRIEAPPIRHDEVEVINGPEDVDYDAARPMRLSAAMLNEIPEDLPDFKLHQLSIKMGRPVTAKVRLVNLTDRALITGLPTNVRELAQKLFFSGNSNQQKKKSALVEMDNTATRIKQVARAYGCAGFLEPKLVLTEAEEDLDNNVWFVDRIPLHDLQEYVRICEGDDQLAERRLIRFPE